MYLLKQYSHLKSDNKGILHIDGIGYKDILKKYKTPVFIYSSKRIRENCRKIKSVIEKSGFKNKFFYSYKTNLNSKICEIIHQEGFGSEVTSLFEFKEAVKNNLNPEMIIFDGPFKSQEALKYTIKNSIRLINADSLEEVEKINRIAKKLKVRQEIGLTLNPDKKSKIGIKIDQRNIEKIKQLIDKLKNIDITCIHCHMKTQNLKMESFGTLLEKFFKINDSFVEAGIFSFKNFDLGGGFPEAAIIGEQIEKLSGILKIIRLKFNNDINLFFEPGRYIVGDSGILLTKIVNIKELESNRWIILDAGTNIISPFSKANNRFVITHKLLENYSTEYNIAGPLPASFDVLNRNYPLPEKINKNDIVGILNIGAYSQSFAIDFGERKIKTVILD